VTSHLPHAVAAVLATMVPETSFRLTGAGFQETTRIAGGDPELWKQIFLMNRPNLLAALEQYESRLKALHEALRDGDPAKIQEILTRAKNHRNALGS